MFLHIVHRRESLERHASHPCGFSASGNTAAQVVAGQSSEPTVSVRYLQEANCCEASIWPIAPPGRDHRSRLVAKMERGRVNCDRAACRNESTALTRESVARRADSTDVDVRQLQELIVVVGEVPVMPRKFAAIARFDGDPTVPLTS